MDYASGAALLAAEPEGGGGVGGPLDKGSARAAVSFNRARFMRRATAWRAIEDALGVEGADGRPDPASASQVATFQQQQGLTVDGKIGRRTEKALGARFGALGATPGESVQKDTEGATKPPAVKAKEALEQAARKPAQTPSESTAQTKVGADPDVDDQAAEALRDGAQGGAATTEKTELVDMETFYASATHAPDGTLTTRGIKQAADAMRAHSPRWDPAWLVLAQKALGAPTDGGFSAAFVRAIATFQQSLGVARPDGRLHTHGTAQALTKAHALPAEMTFDGGDAMEQPNSKSGKLRAFAQQGSKMRQRNVVRYGFAKSWPQWVAEMRTIRFLGSSMTVHESLCQRVLAAERYLMLKAKGTPLEGKPAEIGQAMGCTRIDSGIRLESKGMHNLGLAFDINVADNPWVLGQNDKGQHNVNTREVIERAVLFTKRGEALAQVGARSNRSLPRKLNQMGKQLTTNEMADRVLASNEALTIYRACAKDEALLAKHFGEASEEVKARGLDAWRKQIQSDHRKLSSRRGNWDGHGSSDTGFTTYKKELLIALRDVGGLAWGGCDLDGDSGDMMHWDMRSTPMGMKVKFGKTTAQKRMAHQGVEDVQAD